MVGIVVSFWDGLLSVAMLALGSVPIVFIATKWGLFCHVYNPQCVIDTCQWHQIWRFPMDPGVLKPEMGCLVAPPDVIIRFGSRYKNGAPELL